MKELDISSLLTTYCETRHKCDLAASIVYIDEDGAYKSMAIDNIHSILVGIKKDNFDSDK